MSSDAGSKSSRSTLIALGVLVLILVAGWGYTYYTLSAGVTARDSSVSAATSQLQSYQTPSLLGVFSFQTSSCGGFFGGNCVYTITGPYANFGSNAANSATVTFIFYSGANHTGQVLCQTTVVLGNVAGRSVVELPQTKCNSNYPTVYGSWTWTFASS